MTGALVLGACAGADDATTPTEATDSAGPGSPDEVPSDVSEPTPAPDDTLETAEDGREPAAPTTVPAAEEAPPPVPARDIPGQPVEIPQGWLAAAVGDGEVAQATYVGSPHAFWFWAPW